MIYSSDYDSSIKYIYCMFQIGAYTIFFTACLIYEPFFDINFLLLN